MTKDSSELNRIWEGYKEDQRQLKKQLDSIKAEIRHLSALYEECRKLWMQGDFKCLSEALDKAGFRFFRELPEKLQRLGDEAAGVLKRLDGISKDFEEGMPCPRCDGSGSIVAEKHYERSEGQIIPIARMQGCPLCKGSGKLRPPSFSSTAP